MSKRLALRLFVWLLLVFFASKLVERGLLALSSFWLLGLLASALELVDPKSKALGNALSALALLSCSGLYLALVLPLSVGWATILLALGLVSLFVVVRTSMVPETSKLFQMLIVAMIPLAMFSGYLLLEIRSEILRGIQAGGLESPAGIVLSILLFCSCVTLYGMLRQHSSAKYSRYSWRGVVPAFTMFLVLCLALQYYFPVNWSLLIVAMSLMAILAWLSYVAFPREIAA